MTLIIYQFCFGQFGQNIVQYDDFTWEFIQSKHFDIYYAKSGRSHAEFTAKEAEVAYLKISDRLNWRLKNRVSIIVYNSYLYGFQWIFLRLQLGQKLENQWRKHCHISAIPE